MQKYAIINHNKGLKKMQLFPINVGTIHFIGIGGIGMSAIAEILNCLGYKISGSDLKESYLTQKLVSKGICINCPHDPKNVHGASVIVISGAIKDDNIELIEARKLHIPIVKRSEMLAEIMKIKQSIAISGTHGKTTTTSIIASLLDAAMLDPTVINGGVINAYGSNARIGFGNWIVAEADESDGSFSKLPTTIAVVTNINHDHVDNFSKFNDIKNKFIEFIEKIPFYGIGILCIDHMEVLKIFNTVTDKRLISYGILQESENIADVFAFNIKLLQHGSYFDIKLSQKIMEKYKIKNEIIKDLFLPMIGIHNVQNSLAAVCIAIELNINFNILRSALGSFMGVKRRFTKVGEHNNITVIDDYAHHPIEIESVLKSAKLLNKNKIIAVMQPHRYTRLTAFLNDFAKILSTADCVVITPVYQASEQYNGVDHNNLIEKLSQIYPKEKIYCAQNAQKCYDILGPILEPNDIVIFLGAGDITHWAYEFFDMLKDGDCKL